MNRNIYVIDDGDGALWCGKYWSKIDDYKKRAIKYSKFKGSLKVFIINILSHNLCYLKKFDEEEK